MLPNSAAGGRVCLRRGRSGLEGVGMGALVRWGVLGVVEFGDAIARIRDLEGGLCG